MLSDRLFDTLRKFAGLTYVLGVRLENFSKERAPLLPGELEILRRQLRCGRGDPWSVWMYRVRELAQAPSRVLSCMTDRSANAVELCAVLYPRLVQLDECLSLILDDLDPRVVEFKEHWCYAKAALGCTADVWYGQPPPDKGEVATGEVDWSVWEYRGPAWIGMAGFLYERLRQLETLIEYSQTSPPVDTLRIAMRSLLSLRRGEDLEPSIEELMEDLEERGDSTAVFLEFLDRRLGALSNVADVEKHGDPDTIRSMLTMFRNSKRSPLSYIAHDIELVRILSRHFLAAEPDVLEWLSSFQDTTSMVVQGMLHESD